MLAHGPTVTCTVFGRTDTQSNIHRNYKCPVCGYEYDPEAGDPDQGIEPGTPFDDLLDDWTCPVCGAGKEEFEEM